jgi:glycosyltransferase involved in cell wall biosynthesis
MRILFFGDADSVHLQRWVAEAHARGAECHVATRRPGVVPGAAAVHVLWPGHDAAGWFLAVPAVRALARRVQPNLVHGHYVTSNGFWAAVCGRQPVVLTAWGSDILVTPHNSPWMRRLTRWVLGRADLITADSTDTLEEIRGYAPRAELHEVLWGADTDRFVPPRQREPGALHLASLRAWEPNYNIDTLLDACAQLRVRRAPASWHLHLLGGGSLESKLRTQVERLGLQNHVTFHGRLDDAGMASVMQRCAVSISVPTSDATSVSLLESMACGMAAIVSDLPANRQWIGAEGGTVVGMRNAEALAQALVAAVDHPAQLAMQGAHNRQEALNKASRRVQMDAMFALYERLLIGHA